MKKKVHVLKDAESKNSFIIKLTQINGEQMIAIKTGYL